jgi:hypothetical protein
MPRKSRKHKESSLYIFKREPDGPFKLGSSNNPQKRLKEIQGCNPDEVTLYKVIDSGLFCARTVENKVKNLLKKWNVRGEWFDVDPEIIEAKIEEAKNDVDRRERTTVEKQKSRPSWFDADRATAMKTECWRLHNLTGFNYIVDYIIPLNHLRVCGLDTPDNMRIVLRKERGRYTPEDWGKVSEKRSNEDIKQKVRKILSESNRYDALVAGDIELTRWVLRQPYGGVSVPFKEKIYTAVADDSPFCPYGKKKRFISKNTKYSWCKMRRGYKCRCRLENQRR